MACLGLSLAAGCQAPTDSRGPILLFPPPPELPRVQFLIWASGAEEVSGSRSTLEEFVLGGDELDRRRITKPYGVAARDGVVYVCDSKGLALIRMDFKEHTYAVLGTQGPGRLRKPLNVVIDPLGYKFVADAVRKQVVVFSPDDKYVTTFSFPEPCHPVDVAVYGNELYVLDNDATPQILVLDRQTGELTRSFGSSGSEPGQFHRPSSISIGPEGYLYVSDTMNWRIQKLTREGEAVWAKGTPGYLPGQFGRPRGMRVGPDGIVYVVDGAAEIVMMYNSDGEALMHVGGPGTTPGGLVLPSSLALDATSVPYFQKYAHKAFDIEYLLFVASQYGPHLINVYAFGSFPEGFTLAESQVGKLPDPTAGKSLSPVESAQPGEEGDESEQIGEPEERQDIKEQG